MKMINNICQLCGMKVEYDEMVIIGNKEICFMCADEAFDEHITRQEME